MDNAWYLTGIWTKVSTSSHTTCYCAAWYFVDYWTLHSRTCNLVGKWCVSPLHHHMAICHIHLTYTFGVVWNFEPGEIMSTSLNCMLLWTCSCTTATSFYSEFNSTVFSGLSKVLLLVFTQEFPQLSARSDAPFPSRRWEYQSMWWVAVWFLSKWCWDRGTNFSLFCTYGVNPFLFIYMGSNSLLHMW